MSPYETFTIVGQHGDIHLAGLPFQPGAEVEVVVSPKPTHPGEPATDDPAARLLAALQHAHNTESVGAPRRYELHDRISIH